MLRRRLPAKSPPSVHLASRLSPYHIHQPPLTSTIGALNVLDITEACDTIQNKPQFLPYHCKIIFTKNLPHQPWRKSSQSVAQKVCCHNSIPTHLKPTNHRATPLLCPQSPHRYIQYHLITHHANYSTCSCRIHATSS